MAEDPALREARLALLTTLRDTIPMTSGEILEIVRDEVKQAYFSALQTPLFQEFDDRQSC